MHTLFILLGVVFELQELSFHEVLVLANKFGCKLIPDNDNAKKPRKKDSRQFVKTYVKVVAKLIEENILTDAECVFLFKIIPYCDVNTNILVDRLSGKPIDIQDIASLLNKQERQTRSIVKGLVDKNILAKIESGHCFKYCINPQIHWNGGDIVKRKVYEQMFYTHRDNKLKILRAKTDLVRFKKVYVNGRETSILKEGKPVE